MGKAFLIKAFLTILDEKYDIKKGTEKYNFIKKDVFKHSVEDIEKFIDIIK